MFRAKTSHSRSLVPSERSHRLHPYGSPPKTPREWGRCTAGNSALSTPTSKDSTRILSLNPSNVIGGFWCLRMGG